MNILLSILMDAFFYGPSCTVRVHRYALAHRFKRFRHPAAVPGIGAYGADQTVRQRMVALPGRGDAGHPILYHMSVSADVLNIMISSVRIWSVMIRHLTFGGSWVTIVTVVLGGELAVPCTRNPL